MSTSKISQVLAGQTSYDELCGRAQALVRAEWDRRIAVRIEELDLAERLSLAGRPWPEADDDGKVVMRGTPA